MPSSQAAATERRSNERTVTHEPPKLKTTLKTPPKQATNPLQFVKVGPCSLYRTAQEQLQKVQEVKKVKQEIRDDPEDWQSNLDNWKSSRRKRQEHIIERVVEVKKLELEEHDRQRRRSKTFSEMMEERGNRGRKLSISLAMYNEEDANDLSDLGIGTSSGKSSVSGDTHDDTHSVLSDRDSEIDKNHSDVDNGGHENGNDTNDNSGTSPTSTAVKTAPSPFKKETINNGFHKNGPDANNHNSQQEYDSATTATASSPEPEEYDGAIRGYASRVPPTVPRRAPVVPAGVSPGETKTNGATHLPTVKVDILKRREIFEKATRRDSLEMKNNNNNNNNRLDFGSNKSIKERLSFLERPKIEEEKPAPRHAAEATVHERFARDLQICERAEAKTRDLLAEELEGVKPLKERLSILEKFTDQGFPSFGPPVQHNGELNAKTVKERLISLDVNRCKEAEKRSANCFHEQANMRIENSTPSERSSSPDSEYRAPRATFHQSLDSLDADASSGPDTFERVQSLEELDYHQTRRYPASSSSAEVLNDTDREDSGIHTADASCSVSQADEPIEEEIGSVVAEKQPQQQQLLQQNVIVEEKTEFRGTIETSLVETSYNLIDLERIDEDVEVTSECEPCVAVLTESGTADISSSSSTRTSGEPLPLSANIAGTEPRTTNPEVAWPSSFSSSSERPVVYQSPRVPPRRSPPDPPPKPTHLPLLETNSPEEAAKSPLPSPRSKIPTPLPRKSLPSTPSPNASPKRRQQPSEIPVLVKCPASSPSPPTSPRSTLTSPDVRRRTVVEVCEKVVVSPGQAQVTPFITVERYADEASGNTEVRVDEQLTTAYKKS